MEGIPKEDRPSGWHDHIVIDLSPEEGLELDRVKVSGRPGEGFRIRSETLKGEVYDATIWSHVSNGMAREFPLKGYELGGHEIRTVRVQTTSGSEEKIELHYSKFKDGIEYSFVNGNLKGQA